MNNNENKKLALLVDSDNAQAAIITQLLAEVAKYGVCSVKRAYGDWTTGRLKKWKDVLHKHAIQPIQQFSYTYGKNSTDCSLIIDAMDLLHEGNLDGFCLVSSDSDFTRLATRIRETGLMVYGLGERKTPEAFVAACDKFIYTEILRPKEMVKAKEEINIKTKAKKTVKQKLLKDESNNKELRQIIIEAIHAVSADDDWAPLAQIGAYITKNIPSFDPRNYNYYKLSKLFMSLDYLETKKDNLAVFFREKTLELTQDELL